MKKAFKKIWLFVAIYLFESIGAIMVVQHSWWWILSSVVIISLGFQLVEYYAKNWEKFNHKHDWVEVERYIDVSTARAYNVTRYKCVICGEYKEERF
jgi:hypothetical protein